MIVLAGLFAHMSMAAQPFLHKTPIDMKEARPAVTESDSKLSSTESQTGFVMLQDQRASSMELLMDQLQYVQSKASVLMESAASSSAKRFMAGLTTWLIWAVLVFLAYMFVYQPEHEKSSPDADEDSDPVEIFHNEHFRCLHNSHDCICSVFCSPLRWADTMDMAHVMTYKLAFQIMMLFTLLNVIAGGQIGLGVFTVSLMVYGRQEIRRVLGLANHDFESCIVDCCFIFWCPCCAIAQEARVVRDAVRTKLVS